MNIKISLIAILLGITIFLLWVYVVTTPKGGACCDLSPGMSPQQIEEQYDEYLWWERKRNFQKLFGL